MIEPIGATASGLQVTGSASEIPAAAVDLSWSPNGQKLLYSSVQAGTAIFPGIAPPTGGDIYLSNADGTDAVDLIAGDSGEANLLFPLQFSPDGSTVEFYSMGRPGIAEI